MKRLILDALYSLGLVATAPVWLYRMIRHGRYRGDVAQQFGSAPIRYGGQPLIWVCGVSVGEIKAAKSLVDGLHQQLPDYRVAVSSWTDTGMAEARRLFAPDHMVFRRPLDFSLAVARALDRLRPGLVVLVEGDLWPNFLSACNKRDIPVVLVNARMSPDKGYPGYRKMGTLAGKLLFNRLAAIGAQDEVYAERFRQLGADSGRITVTGMMKFDSVELADRLNGQESLAEAMGLSPVERLIVAGGTGPEEEGILLDVFGRLRQRHRGIRLAVVPRKPERFDEVARLVTSRGFALIRRSRRPDGTIESSPPDAVILGDTMGELRKFYALAACVFVGRSLVPMGGSDMIESAALGKATVFGPHTFNFPQADDLAQHGCARVADASELESQLDRWLGDPSSARRAGQSAAEYVRRQKGATWRNVELICRVLARVANPGGIATDIIAQDAVQDTIIRPTAVPVAGRTNPGN